MLKLLIATHNVHKLQEFKVLFMPYAWEIVSASELAIPAVAETALSFVENALLKARNASQYTGMKVLADDSGLVIPALNGAPGIYSARFAKPHATAQENNDKLLKCLQATNTNFVAAYYYCVIVMMQAPDDPTPLVAQGRWDGMITTTSRGKNGFGYDPLFYLPELQCTAAELDPVIKNQMSHRGLALQQLLTFLTPEYLT